MEPHGQTWPGRPSTVGPPPRRVTWRTWAVPVVTLFVGAGVGFAAGHTDPEESPAFLEMEELAADRGADLLEAQAEVRSSGREADRAAEAAEAAAASREAALDQRETDLDAREQALAASPTVPPTVAARPSATPPPTPPPATPPRPSVSSPAAPPSVPPPVAGSGGSQGQRNARAKAQSYLGYTSFSRSGLIDQLEFEGFSTADATWAVDDLAPNWNEQAAKKAQSYLGYTSFSRSGLIDQLVFEGFTAEQAEYGVTAAGY